MSTNRYENQIQNNIVLSIHIMKYQLFQPKTVFIRITLELFRGVIIAGTLQLFYNVNYAY